MGFLPLRQTTNRHLNDIETLTKGLLETEAWKEETFGATLRPPTMPPCRANKHKHTQIKFVACPENTHEGCRVECGVWSDCVNEMFFRLTDWVTDSCSGLRTQVYKGPIYVYPFRFLGDGGVSWMGVIVTVCVCAAYGPKDLLIKSVQHKLQLTAMSLTYRILRYVYTESEREKCSSQRQIIDWKVNISCGTWRQSKNIL